MAFYIVISGFDTLIEYTIFWRIVMFRKNYFTPVLFVALFLFGGISVFAQTQTVGGKVELTKSDGTKVPVEGAKVDCYRVDIKQGCRSVTTNANGEFTIIGIPVGAKVVLATSGTGIAPQVTPGVAMNESNLITVTEGDGSVPTEEAVRASASTYASQKGELTDAQKAELAEFEKKKEEILANNAKIENKNTLYKQYMKEGKEAYDKGDFDLAVTKYNEGYKVDPEFLGSAPVFLNNKADSLKNRGITKYNAAIKSGSGKDKAKADAAKDFSEALETVNKSYQMTSKAEPSAIVNAENHKQNIKDSISVAKSIVSTMVKINLPLAAYISDEQDAAKTVDIYKTTLEMIPGDPDVLAGLALSLYLSGEFLGSKDLKQQSLNYYTEYVKVAPKEHSEQAAAAEFIEILTGTEKLKPQKIQ